MENDTYQIETGVFKGPFALLLELVEKRKLFINDVSLAEVTEDYLKYVNNLGTLRNEEISSFILVASTLILIKSKSLLPNLDLTNEEKGDIKDLEERLRLYELFTKLGIEIKENFGEKIIFPGGERKNDFLVFLPDDKITKESMMAIVSDVLGRIPKKVALPEVEVKKVVSIEEMIDNLTERIQKSIQMSFKDFHGKVTNKTEKVTVIVSFLAMLELVRQGIVHAIQEENSSEIILQKNEVTIEHI